MLEIEVTLRKTLEKYASPENVEEVIELIPVFETYSMLSFNKTSPDAFVRETLRRIRELSDSSNIHNIMRDLYTKVDINVIANKYLVSYKAIDEIKNNKYNKEYNIVPSLYYTPASLFELIGSSLQGISRTLNKITNRERGKRGNLVVKGSIILENINMFITRHKDNLLYKTSNYITNVRIAEILDVSLDYVNRRITDKKIILFGKEIRTKKENKTTRYDIRDVKKALENKKINYVHRRCLPKMSKLMINHQNEILAKTKEKFNTGGLANNYYIEREAAMFMEEEANKYILEFTKLGGGKFLSNLTQYIYPYMYVMEFIDIVGGRIETYYSKIKDDIIILFGTPIRTIKLNYIGNKKGSICFNRDDTTKAITNRDKSFIKRTQLDFYNQMTSDFRVRVIKIINKKYPSFKLDSSITYVTLKMGNLLNRITRLLNKTEQAIKNGDIIRTGEVIAMCDITEYHLKIFTNSNIIRPCFNRNGLLYKLEDVIKLNTFIKKEYLFISKLDAYNKLSRYHKGIVRKKCSSMYVDFDIKGKTLVYKEIGDFLNNEAKKILITIDNN